MLKSAKKSLEITDNPRENIVVTYDVNLSLKFVTISFNIIA